MTASNNDLTNEGNTWLITFAGTRVQGNVPQLSISANTLGSGDTDFEDSISIAVSTVTPGVHAGFRVTYDGQQTGACRGTMPMAEAPVPLAARLTALSSMTSATVSKTTYNTNGRRYTVTITDSDDIIKMESPATCGTFSSGTPSITITAAGGLGTHTGGQHFKLTFDTSVTDTNNANYWSYGQVSSETTGTIDWEAAVTATNGIQTQLNALTNIGSSGVTVTRSTTASNEGYVWTVTFSGTAVQGNVPLLSVTDDNLGSGNTYDDTHSLTVATTTPGVFPGCITYAGETTGCIGWDAEVSGTRASMQSRLEALSTVTSVSVTKSTVSTTGRQFLITFTTPSDTAENIRDGPLSCETFSGATPTFAITSTGGIGSRADGNYFKLTFDAADSDWPFNSGNSEETGEIDWTSDTDIKTKLESLSSIGSGALTVTASNNDLTNEGNTWLITFAGTRVQGNVPHYRLAPIR